MEQLLARLHERPLDRTRPLWELYLIENPDGASTLYVKVHIVLVEELGPLGPLSPVLARPEVDPDGVPLRPWRADMVPSDTDLLIKAGSGALTLGVPSSPGIPAGLAEHTITLPFNDIDAVRSAFDQVGDRIACVIVEPIAGNMNMVPPVPGFHEALRDA